jgi:hypothetical protein
MIQILQITGAVLILAGFAANQAGWLATRALPYLVLNVVGAGILAVVALLDRDWGFLLLEGVWAVVSLVSLIQVTRARRSKPAT